MATSRETLQVSLDIKVKKYTSFHIFELAVVSLRGFVTQKALHRVFRSGSAVELKCF